MCFFRKNVREYNTEASIRNDGCLFVHFYKKTSELSVILYSALPHLVV